MKDFKKKTEETLAKIPNRDEWSDTNRLVKEVFTISDWLLKTDLDQIGEAELLRKGGRLLGIYTYLSNTASRLRAERDIYEQQAKDDINEEFIKLKGTPDMTVTEADARSKLGNSEKKKETLLKEYERNNYDNLIRSVENMLTFFQSGIKVKQGERFTNKNMADQN